MASQRPQARRPVAPTRRPALIRGNARDRRAAAGRKPGRARRAPRRGPHGDAHARDDLRAGRRLGDEDRRRQEARRGRAGELQPRRARRSARSGRTRAARGRARASCSTCAATAAASSIEAQLIASIFVEKGTIVTTRGRSQPSQTLTATGGAIPASDPDGRARGLQHRVGRGDRHGSAAGSPAARRSSARTRSARASSRRRSRCRTAARSTSPSASTSRPTGTTSAAAASSRGRGSTPEVKVKGEVDGERRPRCGAEHARSQSTVSDASHGGGAPQQPAPAGAMVALLERKGRFLAARPLFARALVGGSPRREAAARAIRDTRGAGQRARPGDIVLVQSDRRGSRILRVIGRPEVARDVIEALMLDRGLRRGFEAAVEREARDAAERVRAGGEPRRDLRELATFTIDPVSARDFDDAISAQELEDGATRVWVHIADVAAHVREGSRARPRGAAPRHERVRAGRGRADAAARALERRLLAAARAPSARRSRWSSSCDGARVEQAAFYRSLIRSDARLDYEQVERIFAGRRGRAGAVGRAARRRARGRGGAAATRASRAARSWSTPRSPSSCFDEGGNVVGVLPRAQTESHRLIEHLMIAANEAVAEHLSRTRHALPVPRPRAPRAGAHRSAARPARLAGGAHARRCPSRCPRRRPRSSSARSRGSSSSTCAARGTDASR